MPAQGMRRRRGRGLVAAAVCLAGLTLLTAAPTARGADRIYWTNLNGGVPAVAFANLDGSGGGGDFSSDPGGGAQSLALYPSGGKIFWGSGSAISFANLDGSGAATDLNVSGAPVVSPRVAIDPGAGRIYWSNEIMSQGIYFANLDGSGGGQLNTAGATLTDPIGVTVDPAAGRIYWANAAPTNKISFANLDGSGGGDINTTGATTDNPQGVAVDPAAGRIYWTNVFGQKISFANLNGSGGGDLNTTGATVSNPAGVAVDAAAGMIYWASVIGGKVSFARLDNSGGGDLDTAGATTSFPNYPVLLKGPTGASAPEISRSGRTLTCSQGVWTPDQIASFLYRAPSGFAYQWSQDGSLIGGANSAGFAPPAAGNYRCRVTASNPAGSADQESQAFAFFGIGKARRNPRRGTARLPVTLPDPGTLNGRPVSASTVKLLVRAKGRKGRKLEATGRAKVRLVLNYAPAGFAPSTQTATVRLRKR
jgi:hypothetical protein